MPSAATATTAFLPCSVAALAPHARRQEGHHAPPRCAWTPGPSPSLWPRRVAPRPAAAASRAPASTTVVAAIDPTTLLAVAVSVLGVGGGVGLLVFYERQGLATAERENTQPCVECRGETYTVCTVCGGDGKNPMGTTGAAAAATAAADGASPPDACSYCEGLGKVRCFNCAGSGIQPRFLDRLSPDDFMD